MSNTFFGTLPGWITASAVTAILGLIVRWQLGLRRLRVDADQVANADEANIRDHYAQEVAALRQQLIDRDERYRAQIERADQRHEECARARDELRQKLTQVQNRLTGTVRQFVTFQQKVGLAIPPDQRSPEIDAMMENLQPFLDRMAEWNGNGDGGK